MPSRIRSFTVKGFRAYGSSPQTLNLPSGLAVVWGPNSKGKSSLAEALEFLFTGQIVRRELLASSVDQFADALRNAHLPPDGDVFVSARIEAADGTEHDLTRALLSDYTKQHACTSRLELDGVPATDDDLGRFGFTFREPPLRAPVLTQDTLSYIFSARPTDRATYFKTLLEVADLDVLRNDIAGLARELTPPEDAFLGRLRACSAVPALAPVLGPLDTGVVDTPMLAALLAQGAGALVDEAGEPVPDTLPARTSILERILADRRTRTFPVDWFDREDFPGWAEPQPATWAALDTYLGERGKVDEETRKLTELFAKALELPAVADISEPVDCPLCESELALTQGRVDAIRAQLRDTEQFKVAERAARGALGRLSALVNAVSASVQAAVPRYLRTSRAERRGAGFTVFRIREVLEERAPPLVGPWLATVQPLLRARADLDEAVGTASALVARQIASMDADLDPSVLHEALAALAARHSRLAEAMEANRRAAQPLVAALTDVIDVRADTVGWQDFLALCEDLPGLHRALVERAAHATVAGELDAALRQIDRAKERVLDDKFSEYSGLVEEWWERLRPDEPTFFASVGPRSRTRRTIDFRAGLAADGDRSGSIVRDVIAVFSQSQLHCLGLSLFLARVQHEGLGFVVLDDPILASDDDYRVHFNTAVLQALHDLGVQALVLTQDHASWKELENRYRARQISIAQLFVEDPREGTVIENTSDTLVAKITRAKSLANGGHPDSRKECGLLLREAGERFCKELLVADDVSNGNPTASLTDYDGKTLEQLLPRVSALLDRDPSHPGRFQVFKTAVNRACHDNTPPSTSDMRHAWGEMNYFQRAYLPR